MFSWTPLVCCVDVMVRSCVCPVVDDVILSCFLCLCLLAVWFKVVGAGRGPLVQAALNAGVTSARLLKVYAVEKNPNAIITLRNRAIMDGWDNVTIVAKDMRQWVRNSKRRGSGGLLLLCVSCALDGDWLLFMQGLFLRGYGGVYRGFGVCVCMCWSEV